MTMFHPVGEASQSRIAVFGGYVSLSILLTMMLKYMDSYEPSKALWNPNSLLGKILNKVMLVYPSRFNHSVVLGFK